MARMISVDHFSRGRILTCWINGHLLRAHGLPVYLTSILHIPPLLKAWGSSQEVFCEDEFAQVRTSSGNDPVPFQPHDRILLASGSFGLSRTQKTNLDTARSLNILSVGSVQNLSAKHFTRKEEMDGMMEDEPLQMVGGFGARGIVRKFQEHYLAHRSVIHKWRTSSLCLQVEKNDIITHLELRPSTAKFRAGLVAAA